MNVNDNWRGTSKRRSLGIFLGVLVGSAIGLIGVDVLRTGEVDAGRLLAALVGAGIGAGIGALLLMRR